jgi:deuterolysin
MVKLETRVTYSEMEQAHFPEDPQDCSHRKFHTYTLTNHCAEKSVPFDGVRISLDTSVLDDTAFQSIPSGESYEVSFDIAEFHDLSAGGKFSVLSSGALSFATENSTELVGSVPFYSNRLDAEVDGPQAFSVRTAFHQKRTNVQSDCSGNKLAATQAALANCARQASLAQQAASNGPAEKMEEYFKASDPATRSTVADVFSRIAAECGSTNAGDSRYYCSDVYNSCQNGVLAYTLPGGSYMAYCDLYFDRLPATTTNCHGQDQGNTNLHEMTHLNQIKGTSDFGGYGYNFLRSLTAEQNINHADTYALFANAVALGC